MEFNRQLHLLPSSVIAKLSPAAAITDRRLKPRTHVEEKMKKTVLTSGRNRKGEQRDDARAGHTRSSGWFSQLDHRQQQQPKTLGLSAVERWRLSLLNAVTIDFGGRRPTCAINPPAESGANE
jgi:hypothetical protein